MLLLESVGRVLAPGFQDRRSDRRKRLDTAFEHQVPDHANAFLALDFEIVVQDVQELKPHNIGVMNWHKQRVR
jgi:hypothetical protein